MNLAIMQPYFFPYIGYFSLIHKSDEFIIFDTPQFMRKGWIERNRIAKLTGGSVYIKVPLVKAPLTTSIKDMIIDSSSVDWKKKILAQLEVYKKSAPFYDEVMQLVESVFEYNGCSIVELNRIALESVCSYLQLDSKISVYSEMNLDITHPRSPDEWALNICKSLEATSYINASGGESFFDASKYDKNNIDLYFINQPLEEYKQINSGFEPGLSIIDVMMFNSPERIVEMLSSCALKSSKDK